MHDGGDRVSYPVGARWSDLDVAVRDHEGVEVLEVSGAGGGVRGHFDPSTERLHVVDAQDSLAVAAAVAPYLLGSDQPFGELSARSLAAAGRLGRILEIAPFTWHRAVPLRDRLLLFYCPLARLVLDIVDEGEFAVDVAAPSLDGLGLALASIPLRDLEQRPGAVARWLSAVCTERAGPRRKLPTTSAAQQTARGRRPRRP